VLHDITPLLEGKEYPRVRKDEEKTRKRKFPRVRKDEEKTRKRKFPRIRKDEEWTNG